MVHVLAIFGSPHKDGNSATIANALLDGAMGLSTNLIDICSLSGLNSVAGCRAGNSCKKTGHCMICDDLTKPLELFRDADAVVVAVPIYFGHACSQYRQFEDRLYGFIDSKGKSVLPAGKKVVVIVTCGGGKAEAQQVADNIESVFVKYFRCQACGKIVYIAPEENSAKNDPAVLKQARELGYGLWKN
ncbi:MAG: flavodoxin family protein [Candidatus Methanomethylophilus sp.]|nr:flavodoxin family protein [Methanomethylophilus sp.]MDD4221539.1 flavodoxin family protein [Methanomethylophilus sp.]MDD4668368.1 flavodoxin family protein [Methanomethylophilus sp.]